MSKPVAAQLYSVRKQCEVDFAGTLKKVADMGYAGVEMASLPVPAEEAARVISGLGLQVCSAHTSFPTDENVESVVETQKALGNTTIISGFRPADFEDEAGIRRSAEIAQHAAALAKQHGLRVGLHNHYWEFRSKVNGRYGYDLLMELAPDAFSQLDVFWTANGGADPVKVVEQYKARMPFLHLKDGPVEKGWPMTAIGKGDLDIPAIVGAADPNVLEWLVVELDECATDMLEALKDSFDYLVSTGLGHGR